MSTQLPFGSWPSPVTSALLVERAVGLSQLAVDGDDLYWVESRPSEGGRQVLVGRRPGAAPEDLLAAPWSVRTTVHEYGGQAFAVRDGVVFFAAFEDQRLWRFAPGSEPTALTPDPTVRWAHRYADPVLSPDGRWLLCVRESHSGGDVDNEIVAVATDGSGREHVVVSGHDFFAAPRVSPDGSVLAWLCWDHPNMPWDGTELWSAPVAWEGAVSTGAAMRVAGGPDESVSQPRWDRTGRLHYVSDRSGWWNVYREDGTAVAPMEADMSGPDWVLGQATYAFTDDNALVAARHVPGGEEIGEVHTGAFRRIEVDRSVFASLHALPGGRVAAIAGSPVEAPAVVEIDPAAGEVRVLRRSRAVQLDPADVSVPRPIEFPTSDDRTAHALFYPPRNGHFTGTPGERPPLVVVSHGGPTSAAAAVLNLGVQFWTSRGFAVVDVDYGGSTGYGREYRRRLNGQWGVVDVDDCVNAARHLSDAGLVDGRRMVIRGGSAGGYTTLAALTFRDAFAAGASHYGVADLELLARETHKFEARYLDTMVGPYPACADLYRQRSPVHHADRISCPVILFQGLEDAVVPPSQAEAMVEALRANGIPVAYLTFAGEQHGFRRADTIRRVAEAELYFYGRVLGFEPADDIEPVTIDNAEALAPPT